MVLLFYLIIIELVHFLRAAMSVFSFAHILLLDHGLLLGFRLALFAALRSILSMMLFQLATTLAVASLGVLLAIQCLGGLMTFYCA